MRARVTSPHEASWRLTSERDASWRLTSERDEASWRLQEKERHSGSDIRRVSKDVSSTATPAMVTPRAAGGDVA